eukprot:7413226-Alexandrium_andersonii.AAC.1
MTYLPALALNHKHSELELPSMHSCFGRSELEVRGPRNGLNIDPRSPEECVLRVLFVSIPNLTAKGSVLEVPR